MDALELARMAAYGAVQGATEFLPVSSSGHVALLALLQEDAELSVGFVVLLHAATLLATVLVLRTELVALLESVATGLRDPAAYLRTDEGRTVGGVVLATIPTAVIGLLLKDSLEAAGRLPWVLGLGLLGSAVACLSTRRGGGNGQSPTLLGALLIGLAQGAAVLPGLSRSGSTIAVAMLLGMSGPASFRFSFLLSLPAILGATILTLRDPGTFSMDAGAWVAAALAFAVGWGALVWLRRLVHQGRFWVFAVYLVPVGVGLIVYGAFA
jgi:undecaprenyl-diphosphatase